MAGISERTKAEVKARADILEVVEGYVSLKRKSGNRWWGNSPFSNERTPSFFVEPDKGTFSCYSTSKWGDAFTFVQEIEGLDFPGAIRFLAEKYGIEIEEQDRSPEAQAAHDRKESLRILLAYANEYYKTQLFKHETGRAVGLSYFKERGFTEKTIQEFELGYSLDEWRAFEEAAVKAGHNLDLLEGAGLSVVKEDTGKRYDRFRGRVMFPIHDVSGRPIGFGARTLKKDDKPKYLNSPETEVYKKSQVLYGIFQAKKGIRAADECYLVEGYTDVISLHQAGVTNVVASSGTALTDEQIGLIGRFTKNVTVLYDGDRAGIAASMRGVDLILAQGLDVRVVPLPDGEDPDSYAQKLGGEKFKAYLKEQAKDFILFKASALLEESGADPIKRANVIGDLVESVSKVPDPIKRQVFYQACAQLLGVEEELLVSEGNKLLLKARKKAENQRRREAQREAERKQPPAGQSFGEFVEGMTFGDEDGYAAGFEDAPTAPAAPEDVDADDGLLDAMTGKADLTGFQEQECARLLLKFGDSLVGDESRYCQYVLDEVDDIEFRHPVYGAIVNSIREKAQEGVFLTSEDFANHELSAVRQAVSKFKLEDSLELSANWKEMHKRAVPQKDEDVSEVTGTNLTRLKYRFVEMLCNEKKAALAREDSEEALLVFMQLQKQKNELAAELGIVV